MNILTPKQVINQSFLIQTHRREKIELFKRELNSLLHNINENETEEYNKNLLNTFLILLTGSFMNCMG